MNTKKLHRLVLAAVFTALACLATIVLQLKLPATNGYINMGDCVVLLGAWLLGPFYGAAAGGIGSALADILTGYMHYAPATLLIKALMAVIAALAMRKVKRHPLLLRTAGAVFAELWMVIGYFLYASLLLGKGLAAASSIPMNLLQGAFGIVAALALFAALQKSGVKLPDLGGKNHGGH